MSYFWGAWVKRMRFLAIPLLLLIVVLFFRTTDQPTVDPEQKPEFRTSATFLYQTFRTDRTGADEKYRDKVIQVSGQVSRIEQDDSGQVALILQGDPARLSGVECLVHRSQIPDLRQLQSGQRVIVKGYGAGQKVHVRLKGCRLVHAPPASAVEASTSRFSAGRVALRPGQNCIRRILT